MMRISMLRFATLGGVSLLWLSACSTQPPVGGVVIRDISTGIDTASSRPDVQPTVKQSHARITVATEPGGAVPEEVVTGVKERFSPMKLRLLNQAEQQLTKGDYSRAIETAERGLRVDRKEPQFYRILASAYQKQGNTTQAQQFAAQGLRYAEHGSAVRRQLQHWAP